MKIKLLCLCFLFLLGGCTQSFEKGNIHLETLKPKLRSYFEVPLLDSMDQLPAYIQTEMVEIKDYLILMSPFSYPKEMIIIVHSDDKKWNQLFHRYQEELSQTTKDMKNQTFYQQFTTIGQIYEYTYMIVSENHKKIQNYLLGT